MSVGYPGSAAARQRDSARDRCGPTGSVTRLRIELVLARHEVLPRLACVAAGADLQSIASVPPSERVTAFATVDDVVAGGTVPKTLKGPSRPWPPRARRRSEPTSPRRQIRRPRSIAIRKVGTRQPPAPAGVNCGFWTMACQETGTNGAGLPFVLHVRTVTLAITAGSNSPPSPYWIASAKSIV